MDHEKDLREHLLELLRGSSAHIDFEKAVKDFPLDEINTRIDSSPHTGWELLEHIRIAQWDILEFSRDASHVSPAWPDGYWPNEKGAPDRWKASLRQVRRDSQAMRDLVADENTDLYAKIPHGDGQTILREALLVADHNAYHLGQLVLLKRMLTARAGS
jgi:DinB superfamily